MPDAIEAYLEKHQISPMLNGIVNELVAEMPDDPISFMINGLLKEAATRGQEPALLQRLHYPYLYARASLFVNIGLLFSCFAPIIPLVLLAWLARRR